MADSSSKFPSIPSARKLLGTVSIALATLGALGTLACGAHPATAKKVDGTPVVDAAEQGKIEEGRRKIDEGKHSFAEKKYERARKLLREAQKLGVESQRYEIEELLEKVDKRQAKLWANEVADKLKDKDCAGAFTDLAAPIEKMESEAFTHELRRLVGPDALKCVQSEVDDKILSFQYTEARKRVAAKPTKTVLGPAAWKKLSADVESTILEGLKGQIAADVSARKWALAVDKIEAAEKKGDANEEQVATLLASVREGVAPEIVAMSTKAMGSRDATAVLRQVDALIKLVRWEAMSADAAALAKDKAVPDDVAQKRELLGMWVEAQHVAIKLIKKPEKRWAHGKIALSPPSKIDGASKRDIPHGTEVWVIGTAKDRALLSDSEPAVGQGVAALLEKVIGWAPLERLAHESTAEWLVPDDQLKGERVWAPLRKDEPMLELGIVTDVAGRDISVKRLADDVVVKLTRQKLRNGRLTAGTKVITFCTAKDQPAKVMEPPGSGTVKLKCDGGEEKEEVLASLRTKADLLPPTK